MTKAEPTSVGITRSTEFDSMLFACLKDELKELYDYNRSGGTIYLAWFSLHWTVNLGVLAGCFSYFERVSPYFRWISVTFVLLNVLSVGACVAVLQFVHGLEHRTSEILKYLNGAINQNSESGQGIKLRSAFPYRLSVRIMWLTQSTIWVLAILWMLVLFKLPR